MTTTTYSSQLNVLKTYVSAMTLATLLGLTLLGCESSFEAPRNEARFTAYESAKRNVTPEALVALFRQWKRTIGARVARARPSNHTPRSAVGHGNPVGRPRRLAAQTRRSVLNRKGPTMTRKAPLWDLVGMLLMLDKRLLVVVPTLVLARLALNWFL
jgi:hypothetical protein